MKIYFVRHGESEFNAQKLYQHENVPLSQKGKRQAKILAERFLNIPVNLIISSDYLRARQTAEIINKKLNKKLVETELFGEIRRPTEFIGQNTKSQKTLKITKKLISKANDPSWYYSDEENQFDLKKRSQKALAFLSGKKKEKVLVVSHGGFIKFFIFNLLYKNKVEPKDYYHFTMPFKLENTGITLLEKKDKGWEVITWNDKAHLGEVN